MSDFEEVRLLDVIFKVAGYFQRERRVCVFLIFLKITFNEFWLLSYIYILIHLSGKFVNKLKFTFFLNGRFQGIYWAIWVFVNYYLLSCYII